MLASYSYDAWGKAYISAGSMRNINSLRFRGYYYDTETGFYYLQGRYYDPTVSRFINADSYASTGQGFLGYNMFAYCGNNPVSRVDADGNKYTMMEDVAAYPANTNLLKYYDPRTGLIPGVAPINDPIKDPLKEAGKRAWRTIVPGTYSVGITIEGSIGISGVLSGGIVVDRNGNVGLIGSAGGGGGSPTASAVLSVTRTTATDINNLNGWGIQTGGSVDVGISAGAEYVYFSDPITNKPYHGLTLSAGGGISIAAEMHGNVSYTVVIPIGNIFD